jgi:hypothetical protein
MVLIPRWSAYAAVAFVTNFSGAIGDLWMVREILRFRRCRDLSMVDVRDALAIYSSDPAAAEIAARRSAARDGTVITRLLLRWIAASVVILVSTPYFMIVLAVLKVQKLVIGPKQFALFTYEDIPGKAPGASIDINALIVAGLLFALLYFLLDRRKAQRSTSSNPKGAPHPAFL